MSKYRLIFDIELPDNISQDDIVDFESWLDYFTGTVGDNFYNSNPLNYSDIDVNSNWEAL